MSSTVSPALASALRLAGRRAGEHDRRVGAGDRGGEDPRARRAGPARARSARCRSTTQRGAVDDARRVARRVDVVDLLDPVVLLQRHGVEAAHVADRRERRLAGRRASPPWCRARMSSSRSSTTCSLRSLHRDHRLGEAALGLRGRGALLRAHRVRVDVLAAEALDRRDQVGADALRHERRVVVGLGVHRPGAAVGAHRHAATSTRRRRRAPGPPSRSDLLRGDVDRLQPGRAEAVELDAGDGVGQAGLDRGGLGDVGALVADGRHAAEHDVVDRGRDPDARCGRASRASGRRPGRPA